MQVEFHRHAPGRPWTYAKLDQLQREVAERAREEQPGMLLISEVAPVITFGRRAGAEELRVPREALAELGIEVYPTDRGGLATYHGPGQWVAFAVDRLEALTGDRRGVRRAVDGLLDAALEVSRRVDPSAEARTGCELGIWTQRGKVAALGVQIEKGVLLHGIALNGFKTATSFVGLRPCGLDAPVDYLLGDDPRGFEELGQGLARAIQSRFWR